MLLIKWILVCFGVFLVFAGLLMLFAPRKAGSIVSKAGSTIFINYAEITIRMFPAIAFIIYADLSRFPLQFRIFGWFMLVTSLVLFFIPRQVHHSFSVKSASLLKPLYFRLISPFSILFGLAVLYSIS
jgi:uncharacterized membrane protein YfcA